MDGQQVNLSSLVSSVKKSLRAAGVPSAETDAEILVSHALNLSRERIHVEPLRAVAQHEESAVMDLVRKRQERVPLQYIVGECEFMSLRFKIRSGVFIPRPETEVLVDSLIRSAGNMHSPPERILDLGTGCGVIAISLAKYLRPDFVLASDVSSVAVETAMGNAVLNGVEGTTGFVIGDGLTFVNFGSSSEGGNFDIFVCNPPYVESDQIQRLEPEVRDHEPRNAIDGGEDGLAFIERILPEVPSLLREGGTAGLEIGETQADEVKRVFQDVGFKHVQVIKDLAGRDRVIVGRME